ncbi:hypothetical protein AFM11_35105 [Mycolicibacterium wolinskyi]|uniref:F5/8 type C domain-containing protein n=1 Tax=Mycolicibacterium wolinskyi TaxID=59750 RepID=A0A132PB68_9MYCO|nr:hypothetical protein [Mycolicibacterium wolinskyi]KWX19569.1 hypothetical protein AFM11_35105 [Mycolicibacterium wolinskyi]
MSESGLPRAEAAWITRLRKSMGEPTHTDDDFTDLDVDEPGTESGNPRGGDQDDPLVEASEDWAEQPASVHYAAAGSGSDEPEPGEFEQPIVDVSDWAEVSEPVVDDQEETDRHRFNPWVAGVFGVAAVVATIVTLVASSLSSHEDPPPPPAPSAAAKPAPPPPPSAPPAAVDGPLRFTATSPCDKLPGSTSAQLLADPHSNAPWVCASAVPGEMLTLTLDRPAVITAVSIVPGAVNKSNAADQADPWPQYRVVKRLQWLFNDTANTFKSQDTGNKHGEAVMAVPRPLASVVTVLIQETNRPPLVAPPTTTAGPGPGNDILAPIFGGPGLPATPDPVFGTGDDQAHPSDGKFAISSIKLIGHEVK